MSALLFSNYIRPFTYPQMQKSENRQQHTVLPRRGQNNSWQCQTTLTCYLIFFCTTCGFFCKHILLNNLENNHSLPKAAWYNE